jgi:DNA polymerase-1
MPLSPKTQVRLVNTIDDAMAMKRWLSEDRNRNCIAIDTETTSLKPYAKDAKLRLVQMGDTLSGWSVPWDQWGGVFMECLNAWQGDIALHNLPYDAKYLTRFADWQIPWHRVHDTAIMSRIIYPGGKAGLKDMGAKYIDPRFKIGEEKLKLAFKKGGYDYATVPIELEAYWAYGALDTIGTAHLFDFLRADLRYPTVYDLEMGTQRVCYNMEARGARINIDYCYEQRDALEKYVDDLKAYGQERYGLSLSSTDQLVDYFQKREMQFSVFTDSGAPSVDKEQLEFFTLEKDLEVKSLARTVLDMRKADKLRGSYFETFIENEVDGIVHPNINTMGAVTSRMSITGPALQTLPSKDALVRKAIIPHEGNIMAMSDLDQVEFRFFSVLAEDHDLQQTFIRADEIGSDAFTEIGREVYSDPDMQKSDVRRALVKTYIYSSLYGASIKKQAISAGVELEVMQGVASKMNSRFPGMKRFQQGMMNIVDTRWRNEGDGYINTPTTGRRLPVERDKAYKATNYSIQSSCADIFKQNLLKLDASGLGPYLVAPVHDEIIMDIPQELAAEVMPIALECMTNTNYPVPLTAGLDGPFTSWGAKYEKS